MNAAVNVDLAQTSGCAMKAKLFTILFLAFMSACPTGGGTSSASAGPPCCKECGSNSKPCGDSCIADDKQCHKTGGCAC